MRTSWMIVLGCGLTLAACKKEAAPQPAPAVVVADAAVAVAVAVPDAGEAPLSPAIPAGKLGVQVIDLQYGGFEQPGLPAIRDDGSAIVVTSAGDDGGRGYLDLELLVLDGTTGAVTKTHVLADPNETSAADDQDPAKLDAIARTRIAEANATFATGTWRTMVADPDLTFALDQAKGNVTIARGGKTIATASVAKLLPKAKPPAGDEGCGSEDARLAGAYVDAASKRALIEIGYSAGGHNCGAAGPAYAVVAIP